jgi:hypothetical protein
MADSSATFARKSLKTGDQHGKHYYSVDSILLIPGSQTSTSGVGVGHCEPPDGGQMRTATTVLLTRGYHALIDLEDLELVSQYRWRAHVDRDGRPYASARAPGNGHRGPEILMHRLIVHAETGRRVDHRNGDTLDNRKLNLRPCTNTQNIRNQRPHADKRTSKLKGVYFNRDRGKFRAQIMVDRKKYNLGTFADELDAARAYDAAAVKLHGEFARLNFPTTARRSA